LEISLEALGLDELLKSSVEEVMNNITDYNTDPRKTRKITIEIDVQPIAGNKLEFIPKIKTKLASINCVSIPFYYDGEGNLYNENPDQYRIEQVNVKPMKKEKQNA